MWLGKKDDRFVAYHEFNLISRRLGLQKDAAIWILQLKSWPLLLSLIILGEYRIAESEITLLVISMLLSLWAFPLLSICGIILKYLCTLDSV